MSRQDNILVALAIMTLPGIIFFGLDTLADHQIPGVSFSLAVVISLAFVLMLLGDR